jgi:hypothetical protein
MAKLWRCIPAIIVGTGLFLAGADAQAAKLAKKEMKSEPTRVRMGWEPGWKENFRATHPVGNKSRGFHPIHKKGRLFSAAKSH